MANTSTLHLKVDPEMLARLKALAKVRGQSMGELVRRALSSCYQMELLDLTPEQRRALEAYQGGFISLGRLAESMGLHPLELRTWLREHGISENTCYGTEDAAHA